MADKPVSYVEAFYDGVIMLLILEAVIGTSLLIYVFFIK